MSHKYRILAIEQRLTAAFQPKFLTIKDESHLHIGHPGAQDGRGHYAIEINADLLSTKSTLEAHRLVYAALGEMMQTDIHAVSIHICNHSKNE